MLLLLSLIISTCLVHLTKSTLLLERRQGINSLKGNIRVIGFNLNLLIACEETLPICSPHWNQTWYHHKHYTFAWNQK